VAGTRALLVIAVLCAPAVVPAQDATPVRGEDAPARRTLVQEAVREVAPWAAAFGAGVAVAGVLDVGLAASIVALATSAASALNLTLTYSVAGIVLAPPGTLGILLATVPPMVLVGAAGVAATAAGMALVVVALVVRFRFG
jgi:hypothetical protein